MRPDGNRTLILLVSLLALAAILASTFLKPRKTQSDQTVDPRQLNEPTIGHEFTVIPFQLKDGLTIAVPAEINAQKVELMLHTGEDSVVLTEEAVQQLRDFRISGVEDVVSWGGAASSKISRGNRLRIGDHEWVDQTIFVDTYSGPGTDGKFGPALFDGRPMEISFDRRELYVHTSLPEKLLTAKSPFQQLPITLRDQNAFVELEFGVAGTRIKHWFMIHSGFTGTLILDDTLVKEHDLVSSLQPISERELKDSFGNIIKAKKVVAKTISLGTTEFSNVPIELFDSPIEIQKTSILGTELLRRFTVVLDMRGGHVYLQPNAFTEEAFP